MSSNSGIFCPQKYSTIKKKGVGMNDAITSRKKDIVTLSRKKTDQCLLFFAEEKKFRVNFAKETFLKTDTARPEILFATDRKIF